MIRRSLLLVFGGLFITPLTVVADGATALKSLQEKDLMKVGGSLILPQEAELGKQLRAAASVKKKMFDAQREVQVLEAKVEEKRKTVIAFLQRSIELRAQLNRPLPVDRHNAIVNALNDMGDRIRLMQQSEEEEKAANAARTAANQLTEQYVELILSSRKLYDEAQARYDSLAKDDEVLRPLEQYNQTAEKKLALGPSSTFLASGRKLKTLEEAVLTEDISLRRGEGSLWIVNVVFDGKYTHEMAIDTGASVIALPSAVAAAAGLTPKSSDPTVELHMADGRVVQGRIVVAPKVRVGKFTAENVECAVMPPELTAAAPLLGLSFLRHFTFKIDTDRSKLVLSKVEVPEAPQPRSRRK